MPLCETPDDFVTRHFDYIVVGGGTAGLVVATRLSENPKITVGVIEAGPAAFDESLINIPGKFGESLGSKYDWQFETTPQKGINGRSLAWPRGKVLGGTSALNFMTWNRGNKEDFDSWAELGNEGWGWDDMMPYFRKSEGFTAPSIELQKEHSMYFNPEKHGTEGPLQTIYSKEFGESHRHWHSTFHSLGIETNKNHFSGSNVGVWTSLTGVDPKSRSRSYSAKAYYLPNSERPNLVVLTEATALEIVLEKSDSAWIASGVRFAHGMKEFQVKASKEVILCAGSVQSPQLLELSGIGNPKILEAAGIDIKISNPNVGENLQEHIMTAMIYEILPTISSPESLRYDPALAATALKEYTTFQSGVLTAIPSSISYLPLTTVIPTPALETIISHLPTPKSQRDEILYRQFGSESKPLGQIEYNFDVSNYSTDFQSERGKKYGTMLMMLQYPLSRGSIHIPPVTATSSLGNGSNADDEVKLYENGISNGLGHAETNEKKKKSTIYDKPIINPQYYEGEGGQIDFEIMAEAQKFADKICRTAPLSSIIVQRVFPPPSSSSPTTGQEKQQQEEEDFSAWVRNTTITDWHPVGTCAMGRVSAALEEGRGYESVLSPRLIVHGTRNLRVCDASIMPLQVSAHIQATVYGIAEKGAAIILEDWVDG